MNEKTSDGKEFLSSYIFLRFFPIFLLLLLQVETVVEKEESL